MIKSKQGEVLSSEEVREILEKALVFRNMVALSNETGIGYAVIYGIFSGKMYTQYTNFDSEMTFSTYLLIHGKKANRSGESHKYLTNEEVLDVLDMVRNGSSVKYITNKYGCGFCTIYDIFSGVRHTDVTGFKKGYNINKFRDDCKKESDKEDDELTGMFLEELVDGDDKHDVVVKYGDVTKKYVIDIEEDDISMCHFLSDILPDVKDDTKSKEIFESAIKFIKIFSAIEDEATSEKITVSEYIDNILNPKPSIEKRKRGKRVTNDDIMNMVDLFECGNTIEEVMEITKRSETTVSRVLNPLYHNNHNKITGFGRLNKYIKSRDLHLTNRAKRENEDICTTS